MSETINDVRPSRTESRGLSTASGGDGSDRPIPLWPEGVLAVAAGITLLVIGLRHRMWIQRKVGEAQRAVEEFQKQGGIEDITQVAKHATDLLKSPPP